MTMKRTIALAVCALIAAAPSFGWGRLGHATVAKIAENNLTKTTRKALDEYLHGESIVEYASYADDYKSQLFMEGKRGFAHTYYVDENNQPYHYVTTPEGKPINNCVYVIDEFAKDLQAHAKDMPDSLRWLKIVLIVHFVGDMHCPEHVRYPADNTIGYYNVIFRGEELRYHTFWDDHALSVKYPWSFSDVAYLFDRLPQKQIDEIVKGTPYDWGKDNADNCWYIHEVEPGTTLSADFLNEAKLLAKSQIQKAGYRLAHLLNKTFDPKYARKHRD